MSYLVEKANAKAIKLGFSDSTDEPGGGFRREVRNRGEKCVYHKMRYKSYHDLMKGALKSGVAQKCDKGLPVAWDHKCKPNDATFTLGPNADIFLKALRAQLQALSDAASAD